MFPCLTHDCRQAAGLSWPLPAEVTDAALEARLFADACTTRGHRRQLEPDWTTIHRELKGKDVTLSILWDEYIERHPEGYYAGDTVPVIVDRLTGETRQAQIFVAVMGASNFTYAEATWTQALGDWIGADAPWQPSVVCRISSFPTMPRSPSSSPGALTGS